MFDEIEEDTLPGVLGPMSADYTEKREDGTLAVSKRRAQKVAEGTSVVIEDAGDHKRYPATVVRVEDRQVILDVDWTSPIEVVDSETSVW